MLLPGCGRKHQEGSTEKGKVELVFWHSYVAATNPALKRLVERFEAEHPDIKLKVQYVQTGDVLLQKLAAAVMTNTVPDVCWVRTNWIGPMVHEEAIYDIEELAEQYGGFSKEDEEDFVPSLIKAAYYKGKLRGLPIQATCMALGYNRDLFRKAGLDPDKPPRDWQELIEYGKKLTIRKGDTVEQWAFFVPVFTGQLANYGVWQWNVFLWGEGGAYADPSGERVAFNSEAGVRALQLWKDIQHKHKIGTMNTPEQGFESQKVAMVLAGCWDLPHLRDMAFDWAIGPMPAGSKRRVFPVDGEYIVIFRQGKHPKEAWEFARWFVSPEVQEQWSTDANYLPVRQSVFRSPTYQAHLETDPPLKAFADQMPYAHAEPVPFRHGTEIDLLLADAIEKAVRGVLPPKEALDEAARKANEVLAQARKKEGPKAAGRR
jgi:multiple sugar transport system substrate-binding protein